MFRLRHHIINACLVAFDLTLTVGCLFAVFRGFPSQVEGNNWDLLMRPAGLLPVLILFVGWSGLLGFWGLYQSRRAAGIFSDTPTLFKASSAGLFVAASLSGWLPAPFSSNYFLARFFVTTLVVLAVARALLRLLFGKLRELGLNAKNLLVVASTDSGDRIARTIARHEDYGYRLVQRLNYPGAHTSKRDSFLEAFRAHLTAHRIDDVILALPGSERQLEMECIEECEHLAINVRIVPDLLPMIHANSQFFNLDGIPLISVEPYRTEDLRYIVGKRIFDIAFSLVAILLLSPLYFIIVALVKLTSRGPVFVVQERVGLNARRFKMYKFRTMFRRSGLEPATHWTTPGDPNATPLGRWLRRSNLDELPQFFNVLKGDMSIVGPRPERPHFINIFQKEIPGYMRRHYAKCGITGWAQVNGWRGDTSIEQRVNHDLYYIRNWAFVFDLKIILLTLTRSFFHRNAY
ncbi:MAG TPA: exopolysaccharide biosynthesis polyprenyl glycosylphosphotransferase [Terriglobia bacterium]|nr:exopolysaccharide biosynthesis polyprenyl glycosylphosphotransferase [Terriglobia bacterium]